MNVRGYSCPNCASRDFEPNKPCATCNYPNHERSAPPPINNRNSQFRFHLSTLFICTTTACIVFAAARHWGYDGFTLALEVVIVIAPLVEFVHWFRKNHE